VGSQRSAEVEVELDLVRYELRRKGRAVRLERQPMELLILLVEKKEQLVTRDEIVARLWGANPSVDAERSINTAIRKIRLALGDDPDKPRFVETVIGKGYRFVYPIRVISPSVPAASPPDAPSLPAVPDAPPRKRPAHWWLVAGVAVLLSLTAVIIRSRSNAVNPGIHSIAVLPLQNFSADPSQEYIADGMTDELITYLAGIRSLRIISRTSVAQFKSPGDRLPKIARDLNVDAIVEGSVAVSGARVRITAQLIQAQTDRHLWARSYEGDIRDLLALERETARSIATEVKAVVTPDEQAHFARARAFDPKAYDAYLKGRFYWNERTGENLKKSLEFFEESIAKDPQNPLPYAGKADAYNMFGNYSLLAPSQAFPKAEEAARKALEMDDSLAEAHSALGFARYQYDWDWAGAEHEFQRAIELKPNYATAHQWYAELLAANGRFEESLAQVRAARDLDPLSLAAYSNVGRLLYLARHYDEAIAELRSTTELYPNAPYPRIYLGLAYEQQGMNPQATEEFEKAGSLLNVKYSVGHAHIHALAGRRAEALQILEHLEGPQGRGEDPFLLAGVWAALGDRDKAYALLDRAYRERSFLICFIKIFPWMDPLRQDARFATLLSRMGLTA
jgi:TolB-like protein/DNA-binding winged helix-turn-helix (wHTH) protein/Tfp pilus assembly protein PilF